MTTLNVLVYPSSIHDVNGPADRVYIAVGIEHALCAQGDTPQAAIESLRMSLTATLLANRRNNQAPLHGVKVAPDFIQAMFRQVQANGTIVPGNIVEDDVEIQARLAA